MRVSSLSIVFLCFIYTIYAACPTTLAGIKPWSTWSGRNTAANADVTVGASDVILLDVSPPTINNLNILGTLVVDPTKSITLGAYFIYVKSGGEFYAGTSACPHTGQLDVVLYGAKQAGVNPALLGTKVFGVYNGGYLELNGVVRPVTWSSLNATVAVGDTSLYVSDNIDWAVNEKIVLAGTDFYDNKASSSQSEVVTITAVSGRKVTFTPAVKFTHWGKKFVGTNGDVVDTRGEVGLLTRNIRVKGDSSSDASSWGSHIMVRDGGRARIAYIEVTDAGQLGELGRYPIHFHNGSIQTSSYIVGCSIHDTYQRSITVHSTFGLTIKNNVAFRSGGHMYFIEDGNEENNVFDHNLGINPLPLSSSVLLASDDEPAVFWTTNPNNHYYYNVAAEGFRGFWFSLPDSPLGLSESDTENLLRYKANGDFLFNKAYGNNDGLMVDEGQVNSQPGTTEEISQYFPTNFTNTYKLLTKLQALGSSYSGYSKLSSVSDPSTFGTYDYMVFIGFTSFKSIVNGVWSRGSRHWHYGARLADNFVGVLTPGTKILLQSSVIVGETDNVGKFDASDYGRNRPVPGSVNASIVGYSTYDTGGGNFGLDNNFHNFKTETWANGMIRRAGAITARVGGNVMEPMNRLWGNKFFNVDNRVLYRGYEKFILEPSELYIDVNDNVRNNVWVDADGSILKGSKYESFGCGAKITGASRILNQPGCVWDADWCARICPANIPAQRFITIMDRFASLSGGSATPDAARDTYALHITNLYNGITDDVMYLDVNGVNIGELFYTVNLPMNQEYFISFGQNRFLGRPQFSINWAVPGEWIRFAIPVTGAPSSVGLPVLPAKSVTSKAALVKNSYFYDAASKILWIHLAAGAEDVHWDFSHGVAVPKGVFYVTASLSSSVFYSWDPTAVKIPTASPAPTGPINNLCDVGKNGVTKVNRIGTFESVLFGSGVWNAPWAGGLPSGCKVSSDLTYQGSNTFYCITNSNDDALKFTKQSNKVAYNVNYSHLQLVVRSGTGTGILGLAVSFGHCSIGSTLPSVVIGSPKYSDNGKGINEDAWATLTVPLADLGLTRGWAATGIDCGSFTFTTDENRPVEFYVASVKMINATTSLTPASVWPARPAQPTKRGPGSAYGLPLIVGGPSVASNYDDAPITAPPATETYADPPPEFTDSEYDLDTNETSIETSSDAPTVPPTTAATAAPVNQKSAGAMIVPTFVALVLLVVAFL